MAAERSNNEVQYIASKASDNHTNARFVLVGSDGVTVLSIFRVLVTSFSYGWSMASSGSSQSKFRYVYYPKRVEQTDLSVSLAFRSPDDYLRFGRWMRSAHKEMLKYSDPCELRFISNVIRGKKNGVNYSVAIQSIPLSMAVDTVAPTMTLKMMILQDMFDTVDEYGSLDVTDPIEELARQNIYASDIDDANGMKATDAVFAGSRDKTKGEAGLNA